MLEDLDEVDWPSLTHAYGSAGDVPHHLRGLLSDDPDEREGSLDALSWSIYHQGTVYDATAPAVPFLLELLADEHIPGRAGILNLLARIADGRGYLEVHQVFQGERERQTPAFQEELAAEREWVGAARAAVWAGWPVLLSLENGADAELRRLAVYTQALLLHGGGTAAAAAAEVPAGVARWSGRLAREPDPADRANLVYAVALLAGQSAEALPALEDQFSRETDPAVRLVLALKLADLGRLPDRGIELLLDAVSRYAETVGPLADLPDWDDRAIMPRLARLGPAAVERGLPVLLDVVRTADTYSAEGDVQPILDLVFGGGALPAGSTGADLSDAQWRVLAAVADNGAFWGSVVNGRLPLGRYGLPERRQALRDFLARPGRPRPSPPNDPAAALRVLDEKIRWAVRPADGDGQPPPRETPGNAARTIREFYAYFEQLAARYRPEDRARVEKLDLSGYADDAMAALLPLCPGVKELRLDGGEVSDAGARHLAALSQLEDLSLYECPLGDEALAHLAGLRRLRRLGLYHTGVTDAGLPHLAGLSELRKLYLNGTAVTGEGLGYLAGLSRLEVLYLGDCPHLGDSAMPHVGRLKALQTLWCPRTPLAGRGLDRLAALDRLTDLTLSGTGVDDEALRQLPVLPALRDLDLGATRVTAAGLANLARQPSLTKLSISAMPVGNAVLDALGGLANLEWLNLAGADVTDAALAGLDGFPRLAWVDLSDTRITDAAVPHLLALRAPRWVGLRHTALGAAAVARLRDAFPEASFGT